MKKQLVGCFLLLFLATAVLASAPFSINITAPATGTSFNYGASCTIQWTYSADFTGTTQKCDVYCGSYVISPPVLVTQGQFVWTVGRKADGTYIPAGTYEITIESPDYDELSGPNITINPLTLNLDRFNKLLISKIPDCPMCYGLPLKQFELPVVYPFQLELFRGQRRLGVLGKFLPGRLPMGTAKLVLDKSDLLLLQSGQAGFELRAIVDNGKLLKAKALALVLQK